MKARAACLLGALLAGCVATQDEAPASKQAEAYVAQLARKLPPGTSLESAIGQLQVDGFKCREAAAKPMAMGHTVLCSRPAPQSWGVVLLTDNAPRVTSIRAFEAPLKR